MTYACDDVLVVGREEENDVIRISSDGCCRFIGDGGHEMSPINCRKASVQADVCVRNASGTMRALFGVTGAV